MPSATGPPGAACGREDAPTVHETRVADLDSVRWNQRVKAGKATIDGVSIADKDKALALGRKIVEMRANATVEAIRKAIAAKGKS